MKRSLINISLFLIVIFEISCVSEYKELELSKLDERKELTLICTKNIENVNGIEILLSGYSKGGFIFEQTNNSNVSYTYKIDSGIIQEKYKGDWYAKQCFLILSPLKSDSINLKIKYRFY